MEVPYAIMTDAPPPDEHERASLSHAKVEPSVELADNTTMTAPPAAAASTGPSTPPTATLTKSTSSSSLLLNDDRPSTSLTYDSLLEQAGTGLFHYQLLLLCGWANAADAIEILAASFIMSFADDLSLNDADKGWVAAMVFLGMLVGGWLWGTLADRLGRRSCLIAALLINSLGGVLAAFVGRTSGLLLCRFIAGLGVGGSIPVIFTYFIEFLPTSQRGAYMVYLAWFWMVGAIFTAGLAWMIIPLKMDDATFIVHPFHSWRLFTFLCAAPSLACAIMLLFCPESPRFLLTIGKVTEAQAILVHMRKVNGREAKSESKGELCGLCCIGIKEQIRGAYDVVEMEDDTEDADAQFHRDLAALQTNISTLEAPPALTMQTVISTLRSTATNTVNLFSEPHLNSSLKLGIVWFGLSFGYYGITLWIPETFQRARSTDDDTGLDVYAAAFLSAACNLPGNILSVYTVRIFGRSTTLAVSIALSALCVLLVPFVHTAWSVTLILSLFTLVSVPAWNALNLSSTELYPTSVRSSAFGVMAAVGRSGAILGNILFGFFIDSSVLIPMAITAAMLSASAFSAWRLRETKDVVLG